MPSLSNGTNLNADITLTKQLDTLLTLSTLGKYVDKNIQFNLGVRSASASLTAAADSTVESTAATSGGTNISGSIGTKTTTEPSSGYFIRVKASGSGSVNIGTTGWIDNLQSASANATAFYPIDSAVFVANGTNTVTPSASLTGSNVTFSETNNGVSVTATGGGTASASASASATSAGYVEAGNIASATIAAPNNTTTTAKYISGVTIQAPSSGTRSFSITVPNGDSTTTFTFSVDSNGNVVIE